MRGFAAHAGPLVERVFRTCGRPEGLPGARLSGACSEQPVVGADGSQRAAVHESASQERRDGISRASGASENVGTGPVYSGRNADVPGLAAGIVQKQKLVWSGHYGWADIERRIPVSDKTLFQVASVSKTVTACVVMQLVESGQLKLEEDINQVLPFSVRNPRNSDTPITVRHLLMHTSGIRDHWPLLEKTWVKNRDFPKSLADSLSADLTPEGEYDHAKKNFFRWAAGTKSKYANVGVALAAYVAEVRAGRPFEELCAPGVFEPLVCRRARFAWRMSHAVGWLCPTH
ncbi:MAG: serine hydrolase domain-containing protein [Planctomycetaceae bacterium]